MITDELRKGIVQRATVDDEWDYGIQQSWKNVLNIILNNANEVIDFIENDCTADEFSWLSEILNEIIDIIPSQRLIKALRKTAEKYPEEVQKYNLESCIDEAEGHLNFILNKVDSE